MNKKGFSLIEVLAAVTMFAIVSLAAGSYYKYNMGAFNIAQQKVGKESSLQAMFQHLTEKTESSCWITVLNSDHIELHSHDNPQIREYQYFPSIQFEGKQHDDVILYTVGSKSEIVAEGVQRDTLFTGVGFARAGTQNMNDVRYKAVAISSWYDEITGTVKDSSKNKFIVEDILNAYESWNIIFVDSASVSSYEDGTKIFPYKTLQRALRNAYPGDSLYVINGVYNVEENTTLVANVRHLYFGPNTEFYMNPGSAMKLGQYTTLFIEGLFSFSGNSVNRVTLTSISPEEYNWGGITVNLLKGKHVQDLSFSFIDMSCANTGFICLTSTEASEAYFNMKIENNNLYKNMACFDLSKMNIVNVENNVMISNGVPLDKGYSSSRVIRAREILDEVIIKNNIVTDSRYISNTGSENNYVKTFSIEGGSSSDESTEKVLVEGNTFLRTGKDLYFYRVKNADVSGNVFYEGYQNVELTGIVSGSTMIFDHNTSAEAYNFVRASLSGVKDDGVKIDITNNDMTSETSTWGGSIYISGYNYFLSTNEATQSGYRNTIFNIENNSFEGKKQGDGAVWIADSDNATFNIRNNEIANMGSGYPRAAIFVMGGNTVIENNYIHDNDHWGIIINSWGVTDTTIRNNVMINDSIYYYGNTGGDEVAARDNSSIKIENSYIQGGIVHYQGYTPEILLKNAIVTSAIRPDIAINAEHSYINTIYDWYGPDVEGGSSVWHYLNYDWTDPLCVTQNGAYDYYDPTGTNTNLIYTDRPAIVGGGDFSLAPGSTGIGTGSEGGNIGLLDPEAVGYSGSIGDSSAQTKVNTAEQTIESYEQQWLLIQDDL